MSRRKGLKVVMSIIHLRRLYAKGYLWQTGPAQPMNPARIAGNSSEWAHSISVHEDSKYLCLSLSDPTHKITPEGKIKELKKCR